MMKAQCSARAGLHHSASASTSPRRRRRTQSTSAVVWCLCAVCFLGSHWPQRLSHGGGGKTVLRLAAAFVPTAPVIRSNKVHQCDSVERTRLSHYRQNDVSLSSNRRVDGVSAISSLATSVGGRGTPRMKASGSSVETGDEDSNGLGRDVLSDTKSSSFLRAAREGFGTRARNVASTMSVGDVVVPLCSDLDQRQRLANGGIYAGVEYEVCRFGAVDGLAGDSTSDGGDGAPPPPRSMSDIADGAAKANAVAYLRPAYPLRTHLERTDWPVPVRPVADVPLWVSKQTYEAGTALGTSLLAAAIVSLAACVALLVRLAYVPSESMAPTLNSGDVVLVSRSLPAIPPLRPRVGDVVFFDPPPELDEAIANSKVGRAGGAVPTKGKQFLKRVVAVPGESVGVWNFNPYVVEGDVEEDEKDVRANVAPNLDVGIEGATFKRVAVRVDNVGSYAHPDVFPPESWNRPPRGRLGRGEYFVSGDNGARSVDSRVWGALKDKYIFGTAKWIIYPPNHFGPIAPGRISSSFSESR